MAYIIAYEGPSDAGKTEKISKLVNFGLKGCLVTKKHHFESFETTKFWGWDTFGDAPCRN